MIIKNKIYNILIFIIFILFGCFLLFFKHNKKEFSKSIFALDTVIVLNVNSIKSDKEINVILDNAIMKIKYFENMLSKTLEYSDIYKINQLDNVLDNNLEISKWTAFLLAFSNQINRLSKDCFNVKLKNIVELWNEAIDSLVLPNDDLLNILLLNLQNSNYEIYYKVYDDNANKELKHLFNEEDFLFNEITKRIEQDYIKYIDNIEDNIHFFINNNKSKIDLGGIAKGFIADYIKYYLINNGIDSGIINLGGNIICIGNNNYQTYKIGIKKPFFDEVVDIVEVDDKSVVTSGIYERYFKLKNNDKIYHHIINPKTAKPVETDLYSATVISNNSIIGDILSTTFIVSCSDRANEILSNFKMKYNLDKIRVIFIDNDYNIIKY